MLLHAHSVVDLLTFIHHCRMSTSICAKPGCDRAVFVEPRTLMAHKYCGRTHAEDVEGRIVAPHGVCHRCNLHGCTATVAFNATTGRVHDFCSKDHARKAISRGEWQQPAGMISNIVLGSPLQTIPSLSLLTHSFPQCTDC